MTDRLAEIVLGLQRMAEHARLRGDDLRHIQMQERREHAAWLDHQLSMVREVYRVLEGEKHKFAEQYADELPEALPKAVTKGPAVVKSASGGGG